MHLIFQYKTGTVGLWREETFSFLHVSLFTFLPTANLKKKFLGRNVKQPNLLQNMSRLIASFTHELCRLFPKILILLDTMIHISFLGKTSASLQISPSIMQAVMGVLPTLNSLKNTKNKTLLRISLLSFTLNIWSFRTLILLNSIIRMICILNTF